MVKSVARKPGGKSKTGKTRSGNKEGHIDAKISLPRHVTFFFKTKEAIRLPYVVIRNGEAVPEHDVFPPNRILTSGKNPIRVKANRDDKVEICLNSDAKKCHRVAPLYKVVVGDRDVEVRVTEVMGKVSADGSCGAVKVDKRKVGGAMVEVDVYEPLLTGALWMKVSHEFTSAEAAGVLEAGAAPSLREAVARLYGAADSPTCRLSATSAGGATLMVDTDGCGLWLEVSIAKQDNPLHNIDGFDLIRHGLKRVHPLCYAAVFSAAFNAGVSRMGITSCWRPCLGSIVHRAGRGLDVAALDGRILNRQELLGKGPDTENVSEEEKAAYGDLQAAETALEGIQASLRSLEGVMQAAESPLDAMNRGLLDLRGVEVDPAVLTQRDDLRKREQGALARRQEARIRWDRERNKNDVASRFRAALQRNRHVCQIMDPWLMDEDSRDGVAPQVNRQANANQRLHANHLHITIVETEEL